MNTPTNPTSRTIPIDAMLRRIARFIAQSPCSEVVRHDTLVRLKELIAEEKLAAFRARFPLHELAA